MEKQVTSRIKKKSQFAGSGAAVQLVGVLALIGLALVGGIVGAIAGVFICLLFLVIGSRMSIKLICDACGNPVASKAVKICPTCHATFN